MKKVFKVNAFFFASVAMLLSCTGEPNPSGGEDPSEKEPEATAYDLSIVPGITVWASDGKATQVESVAKGEITLWKAKKDDSYSMRYTVDGAEAEYKVSSIWPGEKKVFTLPGDLKLGSHVLKGTYFRESDGKASADIPETEFWVKGNPLTEVSASFVTAKHTYPLDRSALLELPYSDYGTLEISYVPAGTVVEPKLSFDGTETMEFDWSKAVVGRGKITLPYKCKAKDRSTLCLSMVNGDEVTQYKWPVTTAGKDIKYVESFTVAGDDVVSQTAVSISLPARSKDQKLSEYTVSCYPEGCEDAKIASVSVADKSVCKIVSSGPLAFTLQPVYKGSTTLTLKVGKISRKITVTVKGDVLTGYTLQSGLSGRNFKYGESLTALVSPVPSTAFDADDITVTSGSPSVISVTAKGDNKYTFKAVNYGSATFTVKTSDSRAPVKTFKCTCNETLEVSPECRVAWMGATVVKVGGSWRDYTYQVDGDVSGISVSRSGNDLEIRNTMASTSSRTVTVNLTSTVTKSKASFKVTAVGASGRVSVNRNVISSGASYRVELSVSNESGSPATWMKAKGYIVSSYASMMAFPTRSDLEFEIRSALSYSAPAELKKDGKVYARLFDLMTGTATPSVSGGKWSVPAFTNGKLSVTVPYSGDGYGSYGDGWFVYMVTDTGSGDKFDF